jgi:hypothetical protein
MMHSHAQIFTDPGPTFGAGLRRAACIHLGKELPALPANVLGDALKLPKASVEHVFTQHPFGADAVIEVFHEDHIARITQRMCLLKVEIFSSVVNLMMQSRNFDPLLLLSHSHGSAKPKAVGFRLQAEKAGKA